MDVFTFYEDGICPELNSICVNERLFVVIGERERVSSFFPLRNLAFFLSFAVLNFGKDSADEDERRAI